jgi:hypothetical protein
MCHQSTIPPYACSLRPLSVGAHPNENFWFIINPDSGPGSGAQPDGSYQACIPELRTAGNNENVLILGYVHTSNGGRAISSVEAEVNTYAGWGSVYRPDGIFFDEATTDKSHISYYDAVAIYAYDRFNDVRSHHLLRGEIMCINICHSSRLSSTLEQDPSILDTIPSQYL